jgi:hypothetical protein
VTVDEVRPILERHLAEVFDLALVPDASPFPAIQLVGA